MGIERHSNLDKKVTARRRRILDPHQKELPLARGVTRAKQPKAIFQLKTELHRLQERDREWKLMFNMLGHDLKEPLLTLEGFSQLLEDGASSPKDQQRYLKIIREAIHSLHLMVGSLQSVAKLYHDPDELVDLSLREILNSVVMSLSKQVSREKGQIEVLFDDVLVRGDPVRLYQIFLNLIANSLKFHKKEKAPVIQIDAKLSGSFLRISISDNGVGMSSEDLKRIFEPFSRLDSGDAGSREGMGLGLSIVKRIAESFGGRVLVRSQQGVGTTFTVMIPKTYVIKGVGTDENSHHRR